MQNWPQNDKNAGRHCILYAPHCGARITIKPADCVFCTCNMPIDARVPTEERSANWFRLLAKHIPNSLERFEALIGKEPAQNPPGNA